MKFLTGDMIAISVASAYFLLFVSTVLCLKLIYLASFLWCHAFTIIDSVPKSYTIQ